MADHRKKTIPNMACRHNHIDVPLGRHGPHTDACTAITLKAGDGAILLGRTMEWGSFDLNGRSDRHPPRPRVHRTNT